jgi:hypothetical protein
MAFNEELHRLQRFVPLRVVRAIDSGNPSEDYPDIDSRGWSDAAHASIVGALAGSQIIVRLERLKIDASAPLFVTSSDTSVMTIANPADGVVPSGDCEIQLNALGTGGNPNIARMQVRFESSTGPILHELQVNVYSEQRVRITPHVVTINSATVAGTAPTADIPAIMEIVKAIWKPAGITITVAPTLSKTIQLRTANIVSDEATGHAYPDELRTLLATNWPDGTSAWVPNSINAYFVRQIGTGSTLGYGFSRASFASNGLTNPGIVLGDQTGGTTRSDVMFWANDLAHEAGHFFRLWHVNEVQPPNELEDSFSRRNLMHNFNSTRGPNPWPDSDGDGNAYRWRPRFGDTGYGNGPGGEIWRGCQLTIKSLAKRTNDGQTGIARGAITAGPY